MLDKFAENIFNLDRRFSETNCCLQPSARLLPLRAFLRFISKLAMRSSTKFAAVRARKPVLACWNQLFQPPRSSDDEQAATGHASTRSEEDFVGSVAWMMQLGLFVKLIALLKPDHTFPMSCRSDREEVRSTASVHLFSLVEQPGHAIDEGGRLVRCERMSFQVLKGSRSLQ